VRSAHFPLLQVVILAVLAVMLAASARTAFTPPAGTGTIRLLNLTPADGARLPARPMRISAVVEAERELQRVSLHINDRLVQPTLDRRDPRRWLVSYQMPGTVEDPLQRVVLVARDRFGRQQTRAWSFWLDPALSAPAFSGLLPPDGGFAPADGVRLAATVKSDAAIGSATLQIEGTSYPVTTAPAPGGGTTVSARVTLPPGQYGATLTVVDGDGDRNAATWHFTVPDPDEMLAFAETGRAISGGFREFWQKNGGLDIFGLPISNEMREGELVVQYFERARFEYHPASDGLTSEVKLGRLGADLRPPAPRQSPIEGPEARYFEETGHTVLGPFRRFWEERGGLAIFGLPLTEQTREGGVIVQYFERARFELHTANNQEIVLLGHLGREIYERKYGQKATPTPTPGAAPRPTPTPSR
jgi:hypothetical protein